MPKSITQRGWIMIFLLALCWGGSFPAAKFVLATLDPFTIVMYRVGGAAALLWLWALVAGWPRPEWRMAGHYFVLGLIAVVIPFSLITWGQTHIESGLAAILNASTAVFTAILATIAFADERLTARKATGITLAFVGVVIAIGWRSLLQFSPREWAQWAVLAASMCYAISTIYTRKRFSGYSPRANSLGMLSAAAVTIAILNLGFLTPEELLPMGWAWMGLLWLALIATAIAYVLLYRLIGEVGASNTSIVTLLVAPVAIVVAAVLLHERLAPNAFIGFAIVGLGLMILDGRLGRRMN